MARLEQDEVSQYVNIADEDTLRAVVTHWRNILNLRDWSVDAFFVSSCGLSNPDRVGEISIFKPKRSAQMRLLNPSELEARYRQGDGIGWYPRTSMEYTVVHELLHIHTAHCGLDQDETKLMEEEQTVHALAMAFLSLHSYVAREGMSGG